VVKIHQRGHGLKEVYQLLRCVTSASVGNLRTSDSLNQHDDKCGDTEEIQTVKSSTMKGGKLLAGNCFMRRGLSAKSENMSKGKLLHSSP
jgi:hypothetical protein